MNLQRPKYPLQKDYYYIEDDSRIFKVWREKVHANDDRHKYRWFCNC